MRDSQKSNEGWVFLYRSFITWEWYDDTNTKALYIHCILKANYKTKVWRGITIERGQFITSLSKLSVELGLSVSKIRTSLERLESTNEIARSGNQKNTTITVLNYDLYQPDSTQNSTQDDTQDSKQIANKSQTNRKQIASTNKVNKVNKENKEKKVTNTPSKKFTERDYEVAIEMSNPVACRFKSFKIDLENWADQVRILRTVDRLTHEQILEVWKWAQNDDRSAWVQKEDFRGWAWNIRVPSKLTKRKDGVTYYEIIYNQMIQRKNYNPGSPLTQKNQQQLEGFVNGE